MPLRGFLSQREEAATRRTGGAQGATDEAMRQKDRKSITVFGCVSYNLKTPRTRRFVFLICNLSRNATFLFCFLKTAQVLIGILHAMHI